MYTATGCNELSTGDVHVVDVRRSPYARLVPVPLNKVVVKDQFWRPRILNLVSKTLLLQYEFLEKTGRLDNFRVASGKRVGSYVGGFWFNDSDVYKWAEASSYALIHVWSSELYEKLVSAIRDVAGAQEPDGYINTFVRLRGLGRWENLAWSHELYCGGHLIQAAIAARRALGDGTLFSVATRFANLLVETFGHGEGKLRTADGHPEVEMALVELYREVGDRRYLDLANFFVSVRGRGLVAQANKSGTFPASPTYLVDHEPIENMSDFAGSHAVRALYLFTGATDLYLETGDAVLWNALKRLWRRALMKTYITGGFGSRYDGEAFGEDYELPNDRAYSEACAAVAGVMWAWRMFLASGEAEYMDVLERVLYNAALAGISLDGTKYFYVNPLADYFGKHERQPWYECACCPPNIARLIAYMPSMIYAVSKGEPRIWVNLFVESEATVNLSGCAVKISVETGYPWSGKALIRVSPERVEEFSLMIRVPKWASEAKVRIGKSVFEPRPGEYFELSRKWDAGDVVEVIIPLKPTLVSAHPLIEANWSRAAIVRGPLVYCVEQVDNEGYDINYLVVKPSEANLREGAEPQQLSGVVAIDGDGYVLDHTNKDGELYHSYSTPQPRLMKRVVFRAIPYCLWNNRGKTKMQVWLKAIA
uniref:Glycoside hydrolase family 127 protein n=1 Tax=Ignisphaera aggregans TaxID=334771 RepID=A0A7J3Z794_9CREN